MSIRKTITLAAVLALSVLASGAPAMAGTTREFLGSFGSINGITGVAVDLETGNVYVGVALDQPHNNAIDVFGPNGGSPNDGVPSQITGVELDGAEEVGYPQGIAIDNSCYEHQPRLTGRACEEYDPSYGDLYAMSEDVQKFRFNPGKGYELVSEGPFVGPDRGLAIDSRGDLYVGNGAIVEGARDHELVEYKKIVEKVVNGSGEEEIKERFEEIMIPQYIAVLPAYLAVDDSDHVYVGSFYENNFYETARGVAKLTLGESGNVLSEEVLTGKIDTNFRPVAVDRATGAVYVGSNSEIMEFSSGGALQLVFGSTEALGGSLGSAGPAAVKGIAVNDEIDRIYVANPEHEDIDVFGAIINQAVIEAVQPPASSVTRTSALLAGTAIPESGRATYYFQYVPAGEYEPGVAEPYADGGATAGQPMAGGHVPETVERVALTGLLPGTTYHYRMVVVNGTGATYGPDETFRTAPATPPSVVTGAAVEVTGTSVTLTGLVGPRGLPASYVFEVGTDTAYSGARLFGNAGSSTGEVAVSVGVQYLVPGTTYHYRLAATSFDGTSYGQDGTFTTPSVPSLVVQPVSEPLIPGKSLQFPSITGAITRSVGQHKHGKKKLTGARQRRRAVLRACRKGRSGVRLAKCEARVRKTH